MKITKISAAVNIKLGLPNYSSMGFDLGVEADVSDSPEKAFKELHRLLKGQLEARIRQEDLYGEWEKVMMKVKDIDPDWVKEGDDKK